MRNQGIGDVKHFAGREHAKFTHLRIGVQPKL